MKIKKYIQFMYQKNAVKKNMLIYYEQEMKERNIMFLSKILISSGMTILYIVEDNIFCRYCSQALSTEKIIKPHTKYCFKVIAKIKNYNVLKR